MLWRQPSTLRKVMTTGVFLAVVTVSVGKENSTDTQTQRPFFSRVFAVLRSDRYDPTDPTQLSTFTELALQLNEVRTSAGHGSTYGVNLIGSYVLQGVDGVGGGGCFGGDHLPSSLWTQVEDEPSGNRRSDTSSERPPAVLAACRAIIRRTAKGLPARFDPNQPRA